MAIRLILEALKIVIKVVLLLQVSAVGFYLESPARAGIHIGCARMNGKIFWRGFKGSFISKSLHVLITKNAHFFALLNGTGNTVQK